MYEYSNRIYKSIEGLYKVKDAEGKDMLYYGPAKKYGLGSRLQFYESNNAHIYIYSQHIKVDRYIPTKPFKMSFSVLDILPLFPASSLSYDLDMKFDSVYDIYFDCYLRYGIKRELDDKTIQEYVRDYVLHKEDGDYAKCPRRYIDTYLALFDKGITLDFEHPIEGYKFKYIYHLKDEDDKTLSRNICRFFAHFFGLEYGSKVYLYKKKFDRRFKFWRRHNVNDDLIGYMKFDGSGLDFSNFFIFNFMLHLRVEKGLRGLNLIKAMGLSKWVHGNIPKYNYEDYPIRSIRGGWIE